MEGLATLLLLFSVTFSIGSSQKTYVQDGSVQCLSDGVYFVLSTDPATSELYAETGLNITLYTGYDNIPVTSFDPITGQVNLSYAQYQIVATTAYGPNARPLLYNVDQPFLAVPLPGGPNYNYTFGVYCTVPATYNVNITTNTTDDDHGDHGGEVVDPKDHITTQLNGLRPDQTTVLGDPLTYVIATKDNTYAALLPVNCKYYDPQNELQTLPFVSDSCPRPFPDDPDGYFGTIQRIDQTRYELNFKAFSFDDNQNSFLGIDCDIQLCISNDVDNCYKSCWGGQEPSTEAPPTTGEETTGTSEEFNATTSEATTEAIVSTVETTSEGPTSQAATTEVATTEAATTEAAATEATTEASTEATAVSTAASTEATAVSTAASTEATAVSTVATTEATNEAPPPLVLRVKRASGDVRDSDPPTSTTIEDKLMFKVDMPGTDPSGSQPICNDTGLLTSLYAVIGVLAVLIAVLVLTLVYLMCIGRRRKIDPYLEPMFGPPGYGYPQYRTDPIRLAS